jgi:hypothetical protein
MCRLGRPRSIPPPSTGSSFWASEETSAPTAAGTAVSVQQPGSSMLMIASRWNDTQTSPPLVSGACLTSVSIDSNSDANGPPGTTTQMQSAAPPTDVASILSNLQQAFRPACNSQPSLPSSLPTCDLLDIYDPVNTGLLSAGDASRMFDT